MVHICPLSLGQCCLGAIVQPDLTVPQESGQKIVAMLHGQQEQGDCKSLISKGLVTCSS